MIGSGVLPRPRGSASRQSRLSLGQSPPALSLDGKHRVPVQVLSQSVDVRDQASAGRWCIGTICCRALYQSRNYIYHLGMSGTATQQCAEDRQQQWSKSICPAAFRNKEDGVMSPMKQRDERSEIALKDGAMGSSVSLPGSAGRHCPRSAELTMERVLGPAETLRMMVSQPSGLVKGSLCRCWAAVRAQGSRPGTSSRHKQQSLAS